MTLTVKKCSMCGLHDLVPVMGKNNQYTTFVWCPNCDAPKGKTYKNAYDGVGPKK